MKHCEGGDGKQAKIKTMTLFIYNITNTIIWIGLRFI